jgi:glycosyltransferase involved in cell wall biosynthesis
MKILFVNNFRYRGGGEEFLMELLPGLVRKGATVGIVCRPNTPLTAMFNAFSIQVFPIEKSGMRGASSFFKIARIIRENQYDAICIQRGHDIVQAWIANILSHQHPRMVYNVHVADFINSRFLLNRMDHVITISRHIAQKLVSFLPAVKGKISIIHHGIDLDLFKINGKPRGFIRRRFNLSPDTPLISTSGSMWKNQIEFLDALAAIKKEIPAIRYLLLTPMADMPQLHAFKERARELGVSDSVLWHDALPKEDMPSYYADIDIAVSTFRNEGFGIWIAEALAMGTPVVAFDSGGVRDALEGCPAGILIKTGPQEMASEIVHILRDTTLRQRMSEAGPLWAAEQFSRERMVDEYYSLFCSLVKRLS